MSGILTALAEQELIARYEVRKRLRELRELVNSAECEILAERLPRTLPMAIKAESVEEACQIWDVRKAALEAAKEWRANATAHPEMEGHHV